MQGKTIKLFNCRLIRNGSIVHEDLWIRNGIIINPEPVFYSEKLSANLVINCNGFLIVPGFIDTQLNGGYGYDFSSDSDKISEAISVVRKNILSTGVTSFCPTIVTSPKNVYHEVLPKIKRLSGGNGGAGILGVHLEGPFINANKNGAHPKDHIIDLNQGIATLKDVYGCLEDVSIVTLAPELPKAKEVTKELSEIGIVVSVGHSTANLQDGEEAVQNGATFITHLFNAMLQFHHRDPGLIGLLTSHFIPKPIFYGIIADGIHTHPAALRIAYKTHPKGVVLVTDAMAALGLGEGFHHIGQLAVEVKGKRAFLPGTDTLAGSIAPMDDCVRHFIKECRVGIIEGVEAAALHPAQLLGIEYKKGTLDYGSDADLLIIDDSPLEVLHTFIAGELVYSSPTAFPLKFGME